MIALTFLYDEYNDRPKMSEQKNLIWAYSSSPTSVVGTKSWDLSEQKPWEISLLYYLNIW